METLLQLFFEGKICPAEQYGVMTEAYTRRKEQALLRETAFYATLNDEQKTEFVRIMDEYTGLIPHEVESVYIQGMRMGARMAAELLRT